ncbi:MAG: LuxR C-terminal-related transcriptional regulator [Bacteroidota bacterium]
MEQILIIERDKKYVDVFTRFIQRSGFQVVSTSSFTEGIKLVLESRPLVIICGYNNSGFTTIDFYKILEQINISLSVPVYFLVNEINKEINKIAVLLGVSGILLKSFSLSEMTDILKNVRKKKEHTVDFFTMNHNIILKNPFFGAFLLRDFEFIEVNEKFLDFLGYQEEDIINKNIKEILVPQIQDQVMSEIRFCLSGVKSSTLLIIDFLNVDQEVKRFRMFGVCKEFKFGKIIAATISEENKEIKNEDVQKFETLSGREIEILKLICKGYTSNDIAEILYLSIRTIQGHRANIMSKLDAKNTAQLVKYAVIHGLFEET